MEQANPHAMRDQRKLLILRAPNWPQQRKPQGKPATRECVFCARRDEPLAELPASRLLTPKYPGVPSHVLIVPNRHIYSIAESSVPEIGEFLETFNRLLSIDGSLVAIGNYKKAAGQNVPHAHHHIYSSALQSLLTCLISHKNVPANPFAQEMLELSGLGASADFPKRAILPLPSNEREALDLIKYAFEMLEGAFAFLQPKIGNPDFPNPTEAARMRMFDRIIGFGLNWCIRKGNEGNLNFEALPRVAFEGVPQATINFFLGMVLMRKGLLCEEEREWGRLAGDFHGKIRHEFKN
ncbi:Uncharacterised protein [Candidatus Anstonella stagnisolia]|nr:Uncharacterised protein [Candidatus Anstonella stagnisolia]